MTIDPQDITKIVFIIFSGTAVLSTLALYTRQSLLVAYILLGVLLGPFALKVVDNSEIIREAGEVGIIFLLFLLGLHLQPQNLLHSLRKMSMLTLISSISFFAIGFLIGYLYGFTLRENIIFGAMSMFSSTIIGLKLLPTTILHHQHTGELVISILLLQDIIAIGLLLILQGWADSSTATTLQLLKIGAAFPVLLIVAFVFQNYILTPLLAKFDQIHEYIFILSIGWCLCMAELSQWFNLSQEIGAFIAGVALASNPISLYIAESLKPLRDFFLIIFFFTIGAGFNFTQLSQTWMPALTLGVAFLIAKPLIFNWLLKRYDENSKVGFEIGVRLGQLSEFSLLIIYLALHATFISEYAANAAQASVIFTFIISCYWTVLRYPTPLASSAKLRRD